MARTVAVKRKPASAQQTRNSFDSMPAAAIPKRIGYTG
jgi:hypothetical protein